MIEAIADFKKIKEIIPSILEVSGYRNDYVAKKIGMLPTHFSLKKNRGNWTDSEVEKLLSFLTVYNEDVEDYLLLEKMRSLENEETITLAEFKKEMGWK